MKLLLASLCWFSSPALAMAPQDAVQDPAQEPPKKQAPAPIYDEKADAIHDIASALVQAKRENRRVLVQWGGNWCGWCRLLHDHFQKNRDVARKLLYEYDVVLVDIGRFDKNMELAERYGADLKGSGVPFLTVLDGDGQVLANQETGSLENGDKEKPGHDAQKVLAFLAQHQAPYLDANELAHAALERAKAEEKPLLLTFGAPWCGWCHRFEDWLQRPEVAPLVQRHFVVQKVDVDRTIGGQDLLKRHRGEGRGIPWFVFLDGEGKALAYSDDPGQNLGCPWTPQEVAAFRKLLAKVAPALQEAEIAHLTSFLGDKEQAES